MAGVNKVIILGNLGNDPMSLIVPTPCAATGSAATACVCTPARCRAYLRKKP